jgi:dihydroorotase-like cyclic amidohydrolase
MSLIRFPGLIDAHVHLRDPGATQKEDFATASRAAIAGGITYLLDMPNNPLPTISIERLEEKKRLARDKAICSIGFYYGTNGQNFDSFSRAGNDPSVYGLKIYCNPTTGSLLIEDEKMIETIIDAWKSPKPILVHAEGEKLEKVLYILRKRPKPMHICHVTTAFEVQLARKIKSEKLPVTVGVTPHHLFLTNKDVERLGPFALMRPILSTQQNQDAVWEALADATIDIVESDHAPHTKVEKESGNPPYGVPGLETMLGLLLAAVHDKRLTLGQVKILLFDRPKRIFHIQDQPNTYIEFDPERPYLIGENGYETKCGWSPFAGWKAYGKISRVVIQGNTMLNEILTGERKHE